MQKNPEDLSGSFSYSFNNDSILSDNQHSSMELHRASLEVMKRLIDNAPDKRAKIIKQAKAKYERDKEMLDFYDQVASGEITQMQLSIGDEVVEVDVTCEDTGDGFAINFKQKEE